MTVSEHTTSTMPQGRRIVVGSFVSPKWTPQMWHINEMDSWERVVRQAVADGAEQTQIEVSATWGSNWLGPFDHQARMDLLDRQVRLWAEAGIPVTKVFMGDPMGWHMPDQREMDLIYLLEELGFDTGVDLCALVDTVALAEEILGHRLYGHASKAGGRLRGDDLYPMDLPFIETLDQAQHFRLGPTAYEGAMSPWKEPIQSPARRQP